MYLKRLEVSGFKSFADKTELEFGTGITAVVGPNGSGKSNISDSMRWVLGEQSAKSLRGGKMDELIFAGSDTRRPVNIAEVTLVLDNSDKTLPLETEEVTVTRRVTRNGDSDYLVNRQACRLKDIMELFMDTGLGKDAYSIIGQGKIDEILSSKAEDRRAIFEEASGIIKYKSRKRDAEKKLNDTQANLTRLDDIVNELGKQVEPLRRQSEKAEKFKGLKAQIKSVEIGLFVYQMEQLQTSWTEHRASADRTKELSISANAELSKVDAALETTRWSIEQLEMKIQQLQEQLLHASEESEKEEGILELCREREKHALETIGMANDRLVSWENQLLQLKTQENEFSEHSDQLRAELVELRTDLQLEETKLELLQQGLSANSLSILQQQLYDVYQLQAQARNELRHLEQVDILAKRKLSGRSEQTRTFEDQRETFLDAYNHHLSEADTFVAQIKKINFDLSAAREEVKLNETKVISLTRDIQQIQQKIQSAKARLETLQDVSADFEGYAQGTREVLRNSSRGGDLKGVHGAVAELIRVPAKLETAMEIALGGSLQHIIVDREADARAAILFLKQRQTGRATFLPIQSIQGRSVSAREKETVTGIAGWVGVGSELVDTDTSYRSIVEHLLGNVLFAETIEHANKIAAALHHRFRVVTLDGDVVHAGGSMTGGSVQRKGSSLLSRQRQMEELEALIVSESIHLENEQIQLDHSQRMLSEGVLRVEQLATEHQAIDRNHLTIQSVLLQSKRELQQMEDQLDWLLEEQRTQDEEQREREGQFTNFTKQLDDAILKEQAIQQAMQRLDTDRKEQEFKKENHYHRVTSLHVTVATKAQEQQNVEEQFEQLRERIHVLQKSILAEQQHVHKFQKELGHNEAAWKTCEIALADWRKQKHALTVELELKRGEKTGLVELVHIHELETKHQRDQVKELEDTLHQLEVKINRQEVELDTVIRKLAEEYELSYELAKTKYPVPDDLNSSAQQVRDWKRQVAALGDVNLGSIEEFARVSERFEYLNGQRIDLMEAKQALEQIIREMNHEMGKKFLDTFQLVRGHFNNVFRQLFGGGNADLILENPSSPLDSGVEIVAQPPGKKLQNLQLLSGGERALTAMALLFSILHVKPVPFCVLDEVEAALDEANVSRYAKYLRKFSENTQFIVVTHRRGTMEEADVMYGVTMEEGGVSKLVSVHLEELEERMPALAAM